MKNIITLLLLALCACRSPQEIASHFIYAKDLRTNICFAFLEQSITSVPCTEEVEKLIKLDSSYKF